MNPKDLVVILILALVIGIAVFYIVKKKKSGAKCIGCPDGACCSKKGTSGCSCCNTEEN